MARLKFRFVRKYLHFMVWVAYKTNSTTFYPQLLDLIDSLRSAYIDSLEFNIDFDTDLLNLKHDIWTYEGVL